jgi:membrane-associated protein
VLTSLVDRVQQLPAGWVYAVVGLLVFAEDAIFVGFVVPGETATVLGGVLASRGHVHLAVVLAVVIVAAITGDQVGFTIGQHLGPAILRSRLLRGRRAQLDRAQDTLARRGGVAVFAGRFIAFFRAVMPALAGMSSMTRPRFLAWNAAGGITWGTAYVLLGYLAGNSYAHVEKVFGRWVAVVVAVAVVAALAVWQVRRHRRERAARPRG